VQETILTARKLNFHLVLPESEHLKIFRIYKPFKLKLTIRMNSPFMNVFINVDYTQETY